MSKGLCRHKETWWWNEEVAEAVREKKIKYRKWKREKLKRRHQWSIRSVGRVQRGLFPRQRKRNTECGSDLNVQNSICVQLLRSPILAALLHGTRAVGISESLRRRTRNGIREFSQRTPPIFGWVAITLCIGPHSSLLLSQYQCKTDVTTGH